MLVLNYKNIENELINISVAESTTVSRFSPTAKLPCIEHQEQYINDSTDIAHYLE
jgi:glutathione S-transferase